MPFPRKDTLSEKITEVLDFVKDHREEWYPGCTQCQYADIVYKDTPNDQALEVLCDIRKLLAGLLWYVDKWYKEDTA